MGPRRRRSVWIAIATGAGIAGAAPVVYLRFLRSVPVAVAVVRERAIEHFVHGPGLVSSRTEVTIGSRMAGLVERVLVDEGDRVREGQALALLDDRDLAARSSSSRSGVAAAEHNVAAARAALDKAGADLSLARTNRQREEQLFRGGQISRATLDARVTAALSAQSAERSARAALAARVEETRRAGAEASYGEAIESHARVSSPIEGLVTKRQVEPGSVVAAGSTLFRVVDDRTVCVAVRVDTAQMGRVQSGQPARIRLASGAELPGVVRRISHESDPVTRDQEVRVLFDRPPERLTINEEAEVAIRVAEVRGLTVPVSAVHVRGGRQGVLVVRGRRARFVPVRIAPADDASVQVLDGVRAGERVLVRPERVRAGQRVRLVPSA